jgi:RHS repeat-associated protein
MSEYLATRSGQAERGDFAVDEGDSVLGLRSLRMEKAQNGPTVMTKIFSLPLRAPFAVSERPFAIVDREAGPVRRPDRGALRRRGEIVRGPEEAASPLNPGIKVAGPSGTEGGETRLLSVSPTGTYYVYGFDGRLVAEYNGLGICVREYIYMGGKLIAEYRPPENAYLYYATDQIGSTRIVTDDPGAVVYAAAHDPYGGIQKTWTSAYDPALKFSGKERDTESGLDYFGARYYDHSLYRFLSVDPVSDVSRAYYNPQLWNRYAFCRNNPLSFIEIGGLYSLHTSAYDPVYLFYYDSIDDKQSMKGYGYTTLYLKDLCIKFEIDSKGVPQIIVIAKFSVFILHPDDGRWHDYDAWLTKAKLEGTVAHEHGHILDITNYVSKRLKKIEESWRKGKISEKQARAKIVKAFKTGALLSWWTRDIMGSSVEIHQAWLSELYGEYLADPFWKWVVLTHLLI